MDDEKNESDRPVVSLGIVADVQYGDIDDTVTYGRNRYYRGSLDCLRRVCLELRELHEKRTRAHEFSLLNLGDLLEGFRVKCVQTKEENVSMLLKEIESHLPAQTPMYHVYGNHELYGLLRTRLQESPLNTAKWIGQPKKQQQIIIKEEEAKESDEKKEEKQQNEARDHSNFYFVDLTSRVRLVCLDLYDQSPCGYEKEDTRYLEAMQRIKEMRKTCDQLKELEEKEVKIKKYVKIDSNDSTVSRYYERFAPHGGAAGPKQLEWLREQLVECRQTKKRIVMAGHIPLRTECANIHVAWNAREILHLIRQETTENSKISDDGTKGNRIVLAYLGGHNHYGGYFVDELNIHHVTISAILETPPPPTPVKDIKNSKDSNLSYGVLHVYNDRIRMCNVSSYLGTKGSFTIPLDNSIDSST